MKEDIIRMAREARGYPAAPTDGSLWLFSESHLERFAELVAAAEREKVAKWQMGSGYSTGHGETIEDLLVELEWQVRESEREACAKLADAADMYNRYISQEIAAAIRARGQA